jgi:acetyl esterase/lipase
MIRIALRVLLAGGLLGLLMGCSPLKVLNAFTPGGTFTKTVDLSYGSDPRHRLDVYTPVDAPADAPVVVFFYGGSWNSGSRSDYSFVGEALASRGIVAVLADYRLYPQVHYEGFLDDSAKAVGWTHAHIRQYGGDPNRLYVMGHSAGGYNAAMLALDPKWLATVGMKPSMLSGWIGLAGPYDFLPIENPEVKPVFYFPNSPPDSQPINHVSAASPPALLMAAKDDTLVNPERNTGGMARRLREEGVSVRELYFS